MSDTQGANLEGDMPPMGTAPPTTGIARSPLQLPSALQGLAKFFTQSQPQSKPASKPSFPPKPPVITEEQAHQRPQHTGTPASFAPVPPVIPTPADGFSPYMKAADKRDPSQWGDPVRYPRLPATFEVMPMLHQIGQAFAQAGGDVGQAGADTAFHSAAYWDGFMKAQTFKMKQAHDGVALASAQLELAITKRLIDNKNTLDEYTRAAGGDLAKLGSTTIGGVDLRHALWENAIRDGDEPAQHMFEAGLPLDQIINYLHDADKNLRDLRAARAKAGDQEADDAAAYGLGPKAGGGAGASGWDQTAPQEAGAQPSPEAPAAAPKDAADTPDWAKGLDPKLVDAAEQHFRGDLHEGENKLVGRKADQLARQMDTEVNKVLDDAHAGRIKPDEVMPAIRKIAGPRIASDAENVGNYSRPGYGSGMGTGGSQRQGDYNQLLDNIARAADPPDIEHGHQGFVANGYALQDNFKKDNQIRTVQDRINSLPADADEIRRDIFALKQSGKYSMNDINWKGIEDQILAGNPDFQKLESDMIAYSTAFQTIQGGGRATLGGTRDVERTFPAQAPLSTYFSVISGHMGDMRGQIKAKHLDWESRGGNPDLMPRGDRGIEKRIDDYWKIDRKSGALPYDPKNPDNDSVKKPAGKWGPAGEYYWTGADPFNRDAPKNWKRVE